MTRSTLARQQLASRNLQLVSPGWMFIPVGTFIQFIEQIDKDENGKLTRKVMSVRARFAPVLISLLVGADIGLTCPIDG